MIVDKFAYHLPLYRQHQRLYDAYRCYAQKAGLTYAQCWAHSRRKFFDARKVEPDRAAFALVGGEFYAVEAKIREAGLTGPPKRAVRTEHTRPLIEEFFAWVDEQFKHQVLPLTEN